MLHWQKSNKLVICRCLIVSCASKTPRLALAARRIPQKHKASRQKSTRPGGVPSGKTSDRDMVYCAAASFTCH
jgi:hypothetical protein